MKKNALLIAFPLLMVTSCSKDKTTTPTTQTPAPKTPKEQIIGTWVIVSVSSNDPDNQNPMQDCSKDDLWTFKTGGTWTVDGGATLCPNIPQTQSGTWKLDSYPTLELSGTGSLQRSTKIIQLDQTTLKYEETYPQVNNFVFTYTWSRK